MNNAAEPLLVEESISDIAAFMDSVMLEDMAASRELFASAVFLEGDELTEGDRILRARGTLKRKVSARVAAPVEVEGRRNAHEGRRGSLAGEVSTDSPGAF
ncbi:MAG: hypothetical protein IJ783_03110 [Kiritimatiellae bacterium]|nr:hypothetical protein [Kiritimatiellia bacterium]